MDLSQFLVVFIAIIGLREKKFVQVIAASRGKFGNIRRSNLHATPETSN